jgi:autotransporter-associated beta strand protein
MKASKMKNSNLCALRRRILVAAAALAAFSTASSRAADASWTATSSGTYNNAASWNVNRVPGAADNAISAKSTNNAVQINIGDPDWSLNALIAGTYAGDGSFVQNGQTITLTEPTRSFRLGIAPAATGKYTMNSGAINYGSGTFDAGDVGSGIFVMNDGVIRGGGDFAVNMGTTVGGLTATLDGGFPKTGYTWFEQGAYTSDTTMGLPTANSTVTSATQPDHSFQMPLSYTANNALLMGTNVTGSLTLTTPAAYYSLSFLSAAGNGPANIAYTIHHGSSPSESGTISIHDWYGSGNKVVASGGRVSANGITFQINGVNADPSLFSVDLPLTDTVNPVTSIDFGNTTGSTVACIMGISGSNSVSTGFTPVAFTGFNADIVAEAAGAIRVDPSVTSTFTMNGGAIVLSNTAEFYVGNYGVGVFNQNGGTIDITNWLALGRSGGNGTLNMTGGVFNHHGNGNFLVGTGYQSGSGANVVGLLNQSGGVINCSTALLVPENAASGATTVGTYNLSGTASLFVTDWLAVGRDGGTGYLNLTNGAITKTGNGNLDIGASGLGTLNMEGGVITNTATGTWIAENSTGTWNMDGGAAYLGSVTMCVGNSSHGYLNLNGGVFRASGIASTSLGDSEIYFNGGTLQAAGDNANFISGIAGLNVNAGGAVIDTQSYNVGIGQQFSDNGGGLTKLGAGTLTLTGANNYSGLTTVSAGKLAMTSDFSGTGGFSVADGATLALTVLSSGAQFNPATATFGASALSLDLGAFGNPATAPINVAGALTLNGVLAISVVDALPQYGQIPLIQYGSLAGSGSVTLGTLPIGVTATLVNDTANKLIYLNVTGINQPRWDGQAGGDWDIGVTANWINIGDNSSTYYTEGSAVVFDDNAGGSTTVNLVAAVNPKSIAVNNNSKLYTLGGSGAIGGSAGLTKSGANTLAIANTTGNTFTGPVVINGGTVSVSSLANGGAASAIGASSASPTNLVLAGGALSYSGAPVNIDRGFSIAANTNGILDTQANLGLSGQVLTPSTSGFLKTGPASLGYTGAGSNLLSGSGSTGYTVQNGAVTFGGGSVRQTNVAGGTVFAVGAAGNTAAVSLLTNGSLIVNSRLQVGGSNSASTGTITINDGGALNATVNPLSVGYGVDAASTGTINQTGGALGTSTEIWLGQGAQGAGYYNLSGGSLNVSNWLAIGRGGGKGHFSMTGGALNKTSSGAFIVGTGNGSVGQLDQTGGTINIAGEYWVAESGGSIGTNNISGNSVMNISNWVTVGRNGTGVVNLSSGTVNQSGNPFVVGIWSPTIGIWNQTGGALNIATEMWIGQAGGSTGTVNLSGGTVTINSWLAVGREGGNGTLNITGGVFTKNGGGNISIAHGGGPGTVALSGVGSFVCTSGETWIGEDSNTGTWTMNGGSATLNSVHLSQNSSAPSYLNLNGGTFAANEVAGWNTSSSARVVNFNGGTLTARANNTAFLRSLTAANVQAGGAIVDTSTNVIGFAQALLDGGTGGGLTKNGNGTLYLNGVNTYTGATVVNAGTLGGNGTIASPVTVNAGATLGAGNASIGILTINNTLSLAATSKTLMRVNIDGVATNDSVVGVTGGAYAGTLIISNTGSTTLVPGSTFKVFSAAGAMSGTFSSVSILPAGTGSFNPTTGVVTVITVGAPIAGHPTVVNGALMMTATGGVPGTSYCWLTSTNVAAPMSQWTTNTTGVFAADGAATNSLPISKTEPARFYRLKTP